MKLRRGEYITLSRGHAFTLVDAIFAMALAGVMFTALYAGLAFGFRLIKMARENTRATQIMLEKMETIRLYKWEQITNTSANTNTVYINTNKFLIPYYSIGGTNTSLMYTGQVSIQPSGLPWTYAGDMRKVSVRIDWSSMGGTNRTRTMTTFVSRNGMQSYVY
jgi:type II secretory pathway pseudopilin PulG